MKHKFRTAEDYRDHLPCQECEPTPAGYTAAQHAAAQAQAKAEADQDALRTFMNHKAYKLREPQLAMKPDADPINQPAHYTSGGVEVIDAIEAWGLGFRLGNAVKYIARAGKKDPAKTVEDLEKARWYLDREIKKRGGE